MSALLLRNSYRISWILVAFLFLALYEVVIPGFKTLNLNQSEIFLGFGAVLVTFFLYQLSYLKVEIESELQFPYEESKKL